MPKNSKRPAPEPASKSSTLVNKLKPNQTPDVATAEMVVAGLASNTIATREWSTFPFGDVDVTACLNAIVDSAERVNRGDLGDAEALLMAQAVTLNALFTHLAHRAQINMGEYLDAAERYMRLALKAQTQCRATLETLAAIKNPPTVFARQANIAHGPQQVNNGVSLARAGNSESEPNKLLEAHGERLDVGAAGTTGAGDQALATVGRLNRPANS
jgi:hypothetical protein